MVSLQEPLVVFFGGGVFAGAAGGLLWGDVFVGSSGVLLWQVVSS